MGRGWCGHGQVTGTFPNEIQFFPDDDNFVIFSYSIPSFVTVLAPWVDY